MRIALRQSPALLMENLTLPLPRPKSSLRDREATNLYLRKAVKREGAEVARKRYGYSLSELVDRLLHAEINLKKGLLGRK